MTVEEWLGKDNTLGIDIWEKKYRYNGESFDQWLDRVSGGDEAVKNLIINKKFLFGGRILANRETEKDGRKISLSNCYVLTAPDDDIESIFDTAKKLARTYSYGGGCGLDIGKLSPRGAKINNSAKETSGAVSFMDLYSLVTELIGQNGRRAALMISIPVDHPDVEEFIGIKEDLNKVTKANISVRISDRFMVAVENNEDFKLSFTRKETGEKIEKIINAKELYHKFCKMNWDMAEPGMLFWDRINSWNLLSADDSFSYAGVNPCAEESLPGGGSCLLGSLNLSEFVHDKKFDFDQFKAAVRIAVDALNDVLDEGMPLHPLEEQRESVRDWRQIGLGIFGLADCMIKMGYTYGEEESIYLSDMIGTILADTAMNESAMLAKKYGAYPMYHKQAVLQSAYLSVNTTEETKKVIEEYGLRNSQILTTAPTGSLSSMLGVSGGIEPIFANSYTRKTESLAGHDQYYKVYTPIVKVYMSKNGITDEKDLPKYFITSHEINYKNRINMQATWQKHIDASISSTINLKNETTVEDIEQLYLYAWKKGLKGVTIFRDGCKRAGILTTGDKKEDDNKVTMQDIPRGVIIKADDNCIGKKRTLHTGCGSLHIQAFFDPDTGDLLETFFSRGSSGGCTNSYTGLSRMISLSARAGVDIYSIVDQLKSSGVCPSYAVRGATKHDTSRGSSCPVAIGNALLEMYNEVKEDIGIDEPVQKKAVKIESKPITKKLFKNDQDAIDNGCCPQCGSALIRTGGCINCIDCGWTKCD